MYWSTVKLINLAAFRSIISGNRFSNLLTFIHAADDNDPAAVTDPAPELGAVSPHPPLLLARWQTLYHPNREVSIDETLVPFKGRTKLLQYIPSKPHQWGI